MEILKFSQMNYWKTNTYFCYFVIDIMWCSFAVQVLILMPKTVDRKKIVLKRDDILVLHWDT